MTLNDACQRMLLIWGLSSILVFPRVVGRTMTVVNACPFTIWCVFFHYAFSSTWDLICDWLITCRPAVSSIHKYAAVFIMKWLFLDVHGPQRRHRCSWFSNWVCPIGSCHMNSTWRTTSYRTDGNPNHLPLLLSPYPITGLLAVYGFVHVYSFPFYHSNKDVKYRADVTVIFRSPRGPHA